MDKIRRTIVRKIEERGLTLKEVSLEMGRNHAYLQQFVERNVPVKLKEQDRSRLSEILDIPESELGAPIEKSSTNVTNNIPEIDLVAGLGAGGYSALEVTTQNGITFATEAIRDHWRLPDWMLNRLSVTAKHVAAFPAQGDSMEPTISSGDVVFIDTRHRVPSPPGIYALTDDFGGIIVKRLEVVSTPGADPIIVRVSSDNPRHQVRELSLSDIEIVGRFIGRFTT